jgi:undecaprenyl-diphosphatase
MLTPRHDDTPYTGRYWWYVGGLAAALAVFAAAVAVSRNAEVAGWEQRVFRLVNDGSDGLYRTMAIVTLLGGAWVAAASVVGAFMLRYYRLAWRLALSIVAGYALVIACKHLAGRVRPEELLTDLHVRFAEIGSGFPSLHAASAAIVLLSLWPYLSWKWRPMVPLGIALVALSRLYLGVHLPLDVVGGVAIGTAVVCVIRILPQSLRVLLRVD